MSNPKGLLSQTLYHYLNPGRILNDINEDRTFNGLLLS